MKRLIASLAAGVLAASGALLGAPAAQAAPNAPEIESVVFTPKTVIFDSDAEDLSAKVRVDIPQSWEIVDSYLEICNYNSGNYQCSDRVLELSAETRVGNFDDLTFDGQIPNQIFGGLYRGESYAYVYVEYSNDGGVTTKYDEDYYGGFYALGASQVTITGPSSIQAGDALQLSGVASCYRTSGYGPPENTYGDGGGVDVYFRFPGGGDDDWVYEGGASVNPNTGEWRYANLAVGTSGEWAVYYYGSYQFCDDAESAPLTVTATGDVDPTPEPPAPAAAPPTKPRSVQGHAMKKSALITWSSPKNTGGAKIDSYQVHQFDGPDKTVGGGKGAVKFKQLDPGSTYRFYVRAHNKAGWSDWSKVVQVKPKKR
jgi:hypothetical protein